MALPSDSGDEADGRKRDHNDGNEERDARRDRQAENGADESVEREERRNAERSREGIENGERVGDEDGVAERAPGKKEGEGKEEEIRNGAALFFIQSRADIAQEREKQIRK